MQAQPSQKDPSMSRLSAALIPALLSVLILSVSAGVVYADDNLDPGNSGLNPMRQVAENAGARMNHLGKLLHLQPQQQNDWLAFIQAEKAEFKPMTPPPDNADIVALSQYRTNQAIELAQRLSDESDAVHQLWSKLNDEQKMTFDRVMQREMHARRHDLLDARMNSDLGVDPDSVQSP
jgi:phage terminase small subunit